MNGYDSAAMSVTAWWALYWLDDFTDGTDMALRDKLRDYCGFLVRAQEHSGAIPTYFFNDLSPASQLRESATTCISGAVLAKFAVLIGDDSLKQAALKCGAFTVSKMIPGLVFNDFEAYYSCSPKPLYAIDYFTGIRPHSNLSIQWACDQMLSLYRMTNDKKWLVHGEYLLSILSMYQQIWAPPFLPEYLFGGFGVMNTDGEWSDGRQQRFVPTYADYYISTGKTQYLKRAVAACRASFALMDMKENHEQGINRLELGIDFRENGAGQGNAKKGQGYSPENIHHNPIKPQAERGFSACHSGMNWSSGGGLAAAAYLEKHFGAAHISLTEQELICIDGLQGNLITDDNGMIVINVASAIPGSVTRNIKLTSNGKARVCVNGKKVDISPGTAVVTAI